MRVLVVQPGVPAYRRAFFESVIDALEASGHEVVVLTSAYRSARAIARADVGEAPWQRRGGGFSTYIHGANVRYRGSVPYQRHADLVVVELATGCIDTYYAVVRRVLSRVCSRILPRVPQAPKVVVWGHVGAYTHERGRILDAAEKFLLKNADHVLSYTETGRNEAVRRGVPEACVSSLNNTVDLRTLARAVEELEREELTAADALRRLCGRESTDGARDRTLAFVGGLDESKRIDFLAAVLERLWVHDPSVRLLVGGTGVDEHLLGRSVQRGQTVLLGRIGDTEKALLARSSSAIVMPGRVGLIAPESFVLGLPILTTDYPWHAPEFDYLQPSVDSMILADDPAKYADQLLDILRDRSALRQLREAALARSGWPPLEGMVSTFVEVCTSTLSSRET